MTPRDCDVAIVGAGLAGLAAAVDLVAAGRDVQVLEADDAVGGRVRTDYADGLVLDRGFQVYNDAYPSGRALLDYGALDLRPLAGGVAVHIGDETRFVADPRRQLRWALRSLVGRLAPLPSLARFAGYAARVAMRGPSGAALDQPTLPFLLQHFGPELTRRVLQPFLSGVVLDDHLEGPLWQCEQVLRDFVRGRPTLPAGGMAQIPEQLASRVGPDRIHLRHEVTGISPQRVTTTSGPLNCRTVILATGARAAVRLVPELHIPVLRDVTTWYHLADCPAENLLDGRGVVMVDGDRFTASGPDAMRPLANTVVLSNVIPEYASGGRVLISSSAVGQHDNSAAEAAVRRHLQLLYGLDTAPWTLAASYLVRDALPVVQPSKPLPTAHDVTSGLVVAGDWQQFPSIDGALTSGRRAAAAVLAG